MTDKYKESRARYYQKNKEEVKRKAREYYHKHKDARKAKQQQARKDNPSMVRAHNVRSKFGITLTEYEDIYHKQGGLCDICLVPISMGPGAHLDHCHTTGKIRGFLCQDCNFGLGRFEDNPNRLRQAITYLARHGVGA